MGFNAKKSNKATEAALSNIGKPKLPEADMSEMRRSMSENTAARTAKKATAAPAKSQSFAEAFRAARAEAVKAGRDPDKEIFTWGGQKKVAKLATSAPAARPTAPARDNKPAASTPKKVNTPVKGTQSNLEEIRRKGAALRASFTGPPSAPAPKKTYNDGQTGNPFGKGRTAQQQANINAAEARAKSYFEQGKANIARAQSMSESDKVKARMRELGIPGYRKGGSVDGCAVRGKTRAPLKGKKR